MVSPRFHPEMMIWHDQVAYPERGLFADPDAKRPLCLHGEVQAVFVRNYGFPLN